MVEQMSIADVEECEPRSELDAARDALDERAMEWVQNVGGYPGYTCSLIPGWTIFVENGGEDNATKGPRLDLYRNRDLVRWYRRAKRFLKDYPNEDIGTAMGETDEGDSFAVRRGER